MNATVLLATPDRLAGARLAADAAALARIQLCATPRQTLDALRRCEFQVFVLDSKLRGLSGLELGCAWRTASSAGNAIVSWGALADTIGTLAIRQWAPIVIPRQYRLLVGTLRALLDPAASRIIGKVGYHIDHEHFCIAFQSGDTYVLARKVLEADDGSPVVGEPRLVRSGAAFEVRQRSGNTYQVPWDLVQHYREPRYPYYRGVREQRHAAIEQGSLIGARVRAERNARDWSLAELSRRTGIHAPNLSRIENAKHRPSLQTVERLASAFGVPVADLVAA
jgi:hypothetical protein